MRTLTTITILAVAALLMAGCSSPATTDNGNTDTAPAPAPAPAPSPASAPNPYAAPTHSTSVFGSGATFPKPLIEAWGIQYAHVQSTVQVSYGGGGSGKGISDITKKDVLFAGSDAPLQPSEKTAANNGGYNILQFPETMGPIGVVYNVAGVDSGLKLSGDVLGQIYAGKITKWNDDAIKALNTGVSLPDAGIAIVYRSDSSG